MIEGDFSKEDRIYFQTHTESLSFIRNRTGNTMKIEMLIGLMGGTLTTISFVPQVLRVWKTRSARDLSFTMFLLFAIGVLLWLIYGIILGEWPVILANSVTLVFAIIILIFKIKYK